MTVLQKEKPSEQSQIVLKSLKSTVAMVLDKKKKLGQYAVVWDGEKPVKK